MAPSRAVAEDEPQQRAPREVFRLSARESAPALGADQWQSLSPHSRGALQSYLSNGPSLAERYGVELAGVDLFV